MTDRHVPGSTRCKSWPQKIATFNMAHVANLQRTCSDLLSGTAYAGHLGAEQGVLLNEVSERGSSPFNE